MNWVAAVFGLMMGVISLAAEPGGRALFNGRNLAGWETWLGPEAEGRPAIGWNRDPRRVFTVVTNDGRPAIRCSGEVCGALVSTGSYRNFRLLVEYKWGQLRWPPRATDQRDSGVFYHSSGSAPPKGSLWLTGSQCSLAEVDSGDFWPVGGVQADAEVRRLDSDPLLLPLLQAWRQRNGVGGMPWQAWPGGERRTFADGLMSSGSADLPLGRWNTAEVICSGDRAVHVINGRTNLILLNLRGPGTGGLEPLTQGRIQLQSESAEIFFRGIEVRPLEPMK